MVHAPVVCKAGFPCALSEYLAGLDVPPTVIIMIICAVVVVLSCFIDGLVLLLIVVPIFYPIIVQGMGYDPIWFGVVIVILTNIGALTPPFAINVFAMKGVAKDVSIGRIYLGVIPFVWTNIALLVVFILIPEILTWLPNMMNP